MSMHNMKLLLTDIHSCELPDTDLLDKVLRTQDRGDAETLFSFADDVCRREFGGRIFLRGIIEFSNVCPNRCFIAV